ncbi:hypothetical protein B0T16DRAFT_454558 [Cercophora newfieldiana]|uniref:Uncharacterized protein n=1 Tax=Cercophora newfieldiana TaxID=92897 RepID=A0AA39YIL4_9PEZI|nr:hypothetical protein B0T16DRAFT_454558 [Cercophora newfieldiana]
MSAMKTSSRVAYSLRSILTTFFGPRRRRLVLMIVLIAGCAALVLVSLPSRLELRSLPNGLHWPALLAQLRWAGECTDELSDVAVPSNKTWPRPRFHLMVDSRKKDAELCKTLYSAAVQGYPPPVLVGYRDSEYIPLGVTDLFELALWVMSDYRSHIQDGDIVMWLGRETLVQLPAEITLRRFLQHREVINARLTRRYPGSDIHQKVLFPAAKRCPYGFCNTTDWAALPGSSLPRDMYGPLDDEDLLETKFTRPRYLTPSVFIGEAHDVVSLLKSSLKASELSNELSINETALWSQLFLSQEVARLNRTRSVPSKFDNLTNAITDFLYNQPNPLHNVPTNNAIDTLPPPPDLSIHLDYESRLFQPLTPDTENDIHPLTFAHPTLAISPSKLAAHLYRSPLLLPPELPPSLSPFEKISLPSTQDRPTNLINWHPPFQDSLPHLRDELSRLQKETTWSSVPFLTNVVVPRGSIPSVVIPSDGVSFEETWKKMWFQPYGTVLLEAYLQLGGKALGEEERWNERGGRGGVWTDEGAWIPWDRLCGEYEVAMFGTVGESKGEENKGEENEAEGSNDGVNKSDENKTKETDERVGNGEENKGQDGELQLDKQDEGGGREGKEVGENDAEKGQAGENRDEKESREGKIPKTRGE